MKVKEILSTSDERFDTVKTRVIVERDPDPQDPLHDWDQVFLLHSNSYKLCGNENDAGYESPFEDAVDEDGFPTGELKFREGVVWFRVAAYIHSGIALSLGSGAHFPDRRWDVATKIAYLWTDKARFEKICCKDGWMTLPDGDSGRRPAKDFDEFREYLRRMAESELGELQKAIDGEVYGYRTEEREEYKKVYPDGREEDAVEYVDGDDSCWGFFQDGSGYFNLDAPKSYGGDVEWFSEDESVVGEKYQIPEFVVTKTAPNGDRFFLAQYTKAQSKVYDVAWTAELDDAIVLTSWWQAQSVAQDVIEKGEYDARRNCVEKDKLKKEKAKEDVHEQA